MMTPEATRRLATAAIVGAVLLPVAIAILVTDLDSSRFERDPDFQGVFLLPEEQLEVLTAGIPLEWQTEFGQAVSLEHAVAIAKRLKVRARESGVAWQHCPPALQPSSGDVVAATAPSGEEVEVPADQGSVVDFLSLPARNRESRAQRIERERREAHRKAACLSGACPICGNDALGQIGANRGSE